MCIVRAVDVLCPEPLRREMPGTFQADEGVLIARVEPVPAVDANNTDGSKLRSGSTGPKAIWRSVTRSNDGYVLLSGPTNIRPVEVSASTAGALGKIA